MFTKMISSAVLLALLWSGPASAREQCPAHEPAAMAAFIGHGHAYSKHVEHDGLFKKGDIVAGLAFSQPTITKTNEFEKLLTDIVKTTPNHKPLDHQRQAFWDAMTGTIVITNEHAADCGTAFRPNNGKSYFDHLR